jgi:hypothetical protein
MARKILPYTDGTGSAGHFTMAIDADIAAEWSRAAQAMYRRGRNDLGHILSVGAAIRVMSIGQYDRAAAAYREWLVFDEPKA